MFPGGVYQADIGQADKEAEKSFQRKIADVNRLRTSKNDTLREIHLYLSADLQAPSCPIAGAMPEITHRITDNLSEIHFLPQSESPISGVIRFKRHVKARYDHTRKAWIPLDDPRWEWEGVVLVIITADEVVDMITNSHRGEGLRDWAGDVRLALGMKTSDQMAVMIKGLSKYYSKLKSLQNKEYTAAARAGVAGKEISGAAHGAGLSGRPDKEVIEMELVKLQMEKQCFLVHGQLALAAVGVVLIISRDN
jgi:crossover junction endonuclease EME1